MNVIISNKNEGLLTSLDRDVIKSINGEFEADDIKIYEFKYCPYCGKKIKIVDS